MNVLHRHGNLRQSIADSRIGITCWKIIKRQHFLNSMHQPPMNTHIQVFKSLKTNPQFSQISPHWLELNCCQKRILFSPRTGKSGHCLRSKLHLSWLSPLPCSPQCLLSFYITFTSHHAAGSCGSCLLTNACWCFHHQVNVSVLVKPSPLKRSRFLRVFVHLSPPVIKGLWWSSSYDDITFEYHWN